MESLDQRIENAERIINELDAYIENSSSKTLQSLASNTKGLVEECIGNLVSAINSTTEYIKEQTTKRSERLIAFTNFLQDTTIKSAALMQSDLPLDHKEAISKENLDIVSKVQDKLAFEGKVYDLTVEVFQKCASELERTLFDFILKPDQGQFHYETAKDVIDKLLGNLIPTVGMLKTGVEVVQSLQKSQPANRRKKFAKDGDKVLLYIEKIEDALLSWQALCRKYIEIVES